jgi:hypothetical protein
MLIGAPPAVTVAVATTGPSVPSNVPLITRFTPNPGKKLVVKFPLESVVTAQGPAVRITQYWGAGDPLECWTWPVIGASFGWIGWLTTGGQPPSLGARLGDGLGAAVEHAFPIKRRAAPAQIGRIKPLAMPSS